MSGRFVAIATPPRPARPALSQQAAPDRRAHRHVMIDLLRGMTALTVATDHFLKKLNGSVFPRAHLAVELFFLISGFVLTKRMIARPWAAAPVARFMAHRIGRLYPVFAAGIAIGALEYAAARAGGVPGWATPIAADDIAANFLLLPALWSSGMLFPINGPMWTLPIEFGLNAALLPLIRVRRVYLLALIVLAGAAMVAAAARAGTLNLGWSWGTMAGGWARGAFAFLTGILLARTRGIRLESVWWALPILAGFALLIACPAPARWEVAIQLTGALMIVPMLFLLASNARLPDGFAPFARLLAGLSFPLYCCHTAIVRVVIGLGHRLPMPAPSLTGLYLLLCLGVALAAIRFPRLIGGARRTRRPAPG